MPSVRLEMREEQQRASSGAVLFEHRLVCLYFIRFKEAASLLVQIGNRDLESLDKTIHHDARGGRTGFGSGSHGLEERNSLSFDQGCHSLSQVNPKISK